MKRLGVYIHIPFCVRKCNYCDFCSYTDETVGLMERYTDELCRRIKQFGDGGERLVAETVYFGGGTPTLLPIKHFERLMAVLNDRFHIEGNAEITVECNPATMKKDGFAALRSLGVNRLSMGLQSSNDGELRVLGRLHSFADFCESFSAAREAGFDNVSVDVMYGIPDQTPQSFEATLRQVCRLSPEHISAYGLKIEEGTPFARIKDKLILPDEEQEFLMYRACNDILSEHGYSRYEISNFAKVGRESRHNLKYWRLEDYIGFGVAAHSCVDGVRFGNSRDINAFIDGKDITEERYEISSEERVREYVMLRLRLADGLDMNEYQGLTGRSFKADFPKIDEFVRMGLLKEKNERISFTTEGVFVSNAILSEMLNFEQEQE